MTAQRNDKVIFRDTQYLLLGITGDSILFDPVAWGFAPKRITTAVHRGYICHYAIEGSRVVLECVQIRTDGNETWPLGAGLPEPVTDYVGVVKYTRPDIEFDHTGSLLLGHAIPTGGLRTGFVEIDRAKDLIELVVVSGTITKIVLDPRDTIKFDNYWAKHVGIATSLPLRKEFGLAPLPR